MSIGPIIARRDVLRLLVAGGVTAAVPRTAAQASPAARPIPSTGESLPAVGLGSWITFNVGDDPVAKDRCADVMAAFFQAGGRLIDSSPMYGSSQATIGHGLRRVGTPSAVFSADKVWIGSGRHGPGQIEES